MGIPPELIFCHHYLARVLLVAIASYQSSLDYCTMLLPSWLMALVILLHTLSMENMISWHFNNPRVSSLFSMRTSWINSVNLLLFSSFFRKSLKFLGIFDKADCTITRLHVPRVNLSGFFKDCLRYVPTTMSIISYPFGIMLNSLYTVWQTFICHKLLIIFWLGPSSQLIVPQICPLIPGSHLDQQTHRSRWGFHPWVYFLLLFFLFHLDTQSRVG